jgi:TRAP-type C4-dicarboxylate transport system substrate-binding protein
MKLVPGKLDAIIVSEPEKIPAGARYLGEIHDRPDLWSIAVREAVWQSWSSELRDAAMKAAAEASKTLTREGEKQRAVLIREAKAKHIETGLVDSFSIHRQLDLLYASFIEYGDINPRVLQTAREAERPKP